MRSNRHSKNQWNGKNVCRNKLFVVSAAAVAGLLSAKSFAATSTWTGLNSTANWSDSANWSAGVPGYNLGGSINSIDFATFNAAGNPSFLNILVDSGRNIAGITFDTAAAAAYTIGSTSGNSLLLTSGGTTSMTAAVASVEAINAPLVIEGSTYTFSNAATSTAAVLDIGGQVSGGVSGASILTLTGTNTGANTISGNIVNGSATSLALTKTAAGTWILTGANSYTGTTTITTGTLQIGNGATAGTLGSASVIDNATLAFNRSDPLLTIGNVISGSGGVTQLGSGILQLTGANTYTGATTITAGTVQAGAANVISSSSVITFGATGTETFDLNGFNQTVNALNATQASSTISMEGATLTTTNGGTNTFLGSITGTGAGSLIKAGTGIEILGGTNTYGGATTITGGTLEFVSTPGATGSITVNAGGSVGLQSGSTSATLLNLINASSSASTGGLDLAATEAAANIDFTGTVGGAVNLSGANTVGMSIGAVSAGVTFTGTITPAGSNYRLGGGGTLTIGSSGQNNQLTGNDNVEITNGGVVSLANTENYTGTTTIDNRGILLTSSSASLGSSPSVNLNNGTLRVGAATFDPSSVPLTFQAGGGTIDTNGLAVTMANNFGNNGAGSFTKAGSGVLTLTGSGTYTGGTTINGGTLQIGNATASGALGGGNVTINSGDNLTFDRTDTINVSNNISGAGGFQQIGAGTVTLSGSDSGYTGTVTVNNSTGTLKAGSNNALGSGANTLTVTAGTVDLNGFNAGFNSLGTGTAGSSFVTNSSSTLSTLSLGPGGGYTTNDTFTGNLAIGISGTPGVTYQFNSNANTFTGGITLNSGSFRIEGAGGLSTGTLTFNGGQLTIPSSGVTGTTAPNNIVVNANTTSVFGSQQGTWTVTGNVSGGGILDFDPPTNAQPNVVFSGNDSGFTGTMVTRSVTSTGNGGQKISFSTVNGGSPFGTWAPAGAVANGGIGGSLTSTGTIQLGALSSATYSGGRLYNNSTTASTTTTYQIGNLNNNTTFAGTIQNNGTSLTAGVTAITKVGTGTLTIGGAQNTNATANASNSYTGATNLDNGTLALDFDLTATTTSTSTATVQTAPVNTNGALILGGGALNVTGRANVAASSSTWTILPINGASITIYATGGSVSGLTAGMSVTDLNSSAEIPASTYISSIDPANNTFTVSATSLATSFPVNGTNIPGQILSFGALSGVTSTEVYTGTTIGSGASAIGVNANSNSGTLLALGALTHSTGGTMNLTLPSGSQTVSNGIVTLAQNTNGIIGGYATVGGTDWAVSSAAAPVAGTTWTVASSTVNGNQPNGTEVVFTGTAPGGLALNTPYFVVGSTGGTTFQVSAVPGGTAITLTGTATTTTLNPAGNITALPSYSTDSFSTATNNTDVTVNDSPTAFTVNSLRFNHASHTLGLTGTNIVTSGGILVSAAGTNSAIIGGSLEASSTGKELFLIDNGSLSVGSTIIDDTAASALTVSGMGTTTLSGSNTYSGVTTINQGTLSTTLLTSEGSGGGTPSNIGQSGNAATNLVFNGGTLQYTGSSAVSTDRLFSIGSTGGSIDNEGAGALNFTNTGAMGFNGQAGPRTLTLTGTNSGANTLAAIIGDQSTTLGNAVSIVKNGTGVWALTGANTYTGGTTINSGVLQANTDASLGVPSYLAGNVTFQNGLTINNGTYEATAGFTSARAITVSNANAGIKVDAGTLALSTGIVGTGGLTVTGGSSGILALNGSNAYTGNTKVNSGTLFVNGSLTSTSSATVGGGAALGGIGLINSSTGVAVNNGGGISLVDGQIGTLTVNNGLSFAGSNTFNLELSPTGADLLNLGTSALNVGGTTTVNVSLLNGISPGTYNIATFGSATGLGNFSLATTTIGPNSLSLASTSTAEQLVVTGPPSLVTAYWSGNRGTTVWNTLAGGLTNWTKDSAGTVEGNNYPTVTTDAIFSATDTLAGNSSLLSTTLGQDFSIHSLAIAANVTGGVSITGANALTIGGSTTSTNPGLTVASGAGPVTIGNTTLILGAAQTWTNNSANGLTIGAAISGGSSAALTITGSGNTLISGANTYSGGTTFAAGLSGVIQLGNTNSLGTGALAINSGTLDLHNQSQTVTALTGSAGTITNRASGLATLAASSGSYSGQINDGGSGEQVALVKNSSGTLAIGGNNSFSGGTTINGGNLQISSSVNLGLASGGLTINSGALEVTSSIPGASRSISVGSATSTIQVDGGATYTTTGSITGTGGLTMGLNSTGTGTLVLNGAGDAYQGGTTINAGTVMLGAANPTALGTGGLAVNAGTLDLNNNSITVTSLSGTAGVIGNNSGSGPVTLTINESGTTSFTGTLQDGGGTLAVVKTGAGLLTLGGTTANPLGTGNYTGGLTISGGQVVLSTIGTPGTESTNNLGTNTITVNGGTISGAGALITGGGVLNLADNQGTLTTIPNNFTLNGGTIEQFHGEHHYSGTVTIGANGGAFRPAYGNSSYFVVDGDIVGSAPLTFGSIGSGDNFAIAVLTNANDYTGTFGIITAGTNAASQLWLSNNSSFSSNSAALSNATVFANSPVSSVFAGPDVVFLGDTAVLPAGSSIAHIFTSITSASFGALSGAGPIALQTNDSSPQAVTLTLGGNNASYGSGGTNSNGGNTASAVYSGILSGPGNLIYVGSATQSQVQTLSGDNTYSGGTTVNGGTLSVANTDAGSSGTGTGDVTLNGGTFASGAVGTISGNLLAGSGSHTIAPGGVGAIGSLTAGGIVTSGSLGNLTTLNFDLGTGPGAGDLLTLTTSNVSFGTGTAITFPTPSAAGTYELIGDPSNASVITAITSPNSVFTLPTAPAGDSYTLNTTSNPGFIDLVVTGTFGPANLIFTGSAGNGTWDITSTTNFTTGSGAVVYHDADNVTFNDTNNGQYTVTLVAGPGTANNSGYVSPTSVTVNTAAPNVYTFNGVGIAGTGTLTKTGAGTLVLNNVNTYSGATSINQGTLTIGITGSIGNSAVTVGNGTTAGVLNIAANTSATAGFLARNLTSLSVTSTGTVTLANAATSAGTKVNSNRTVLSTPSLTIAAGGILNLGSNDMIVHSGSGGEAVAATVSSAVASGRGSNGLWTGAGINSSAAAASPNNLALAVVLNDTHQTGTLSGTPLVAAASSFNGGLATFDGQSVSDGDVLVKYTYYGDALLNGNINAGDYTQIDNGFNSGGTLKGWFNGDFNYDGVINGDDYTLIDNAYNTQGSVSLAGISAGPSEMIASNTDQIAGSTVSAVPEPASLFVLGIGGIGLLNRRKRRFAGRKP